LRYDEASPLPPSYRLHRDADVLTVRRPDESVLGHFSARGTTCEIVLRAAEDDLSGIPPYSGPQEHASSVTRGLKAKVGRSWERFVEAERRALDARKNGQLSKALGLRLPGESQEDLDGMVSEEQRRAEKGLVELKSEEGELSFK
jgi:hypothetical protein